MIVTPLVATALACLIAVAISLGLYLRHFRWRESAAGPWIVAVLTLLALRHAITVQDGLTVVEGISEALIAAWNVLALLVYSRLAWQLHKWLSDQRDLDAGTRRNP